jgi:hypothetical protein
LEVLDLADFGVTDGICIDGVAARQRRPSKFGEAFTDILAYNSIEAGSSGQRKAQPSEGSSKQVHGACIAATTGASNMARGPDWPPSELATDMLGYRARRDRQKRP